jgi:ADP-ribose pyrophosphatase YjhB (NUDIX family)
MSEPQLTRIVAGCVLEQDGKYLLVQEKKEAAYGMWNLPAGRVDIGETIEQAAAVREVFEETGYKVELVSKLRVEHDDASRPVLHSYRANIIGGGLAFPKEELLDARWFTFEEVGALFRDGKIRAKWVVNSIEDARKLV